MNSVKDNDLISKSETARRIGVSPTTITKGIKTGRFKVYKRQGKELLSYKQCKRAYLHTARRGGGTPRGGGLSDHVYETKKSSSKSTDVDGMFDLHDIRLEAERTKAKKEKLLLEVALGKYVEYEKTKKEFCNIAETLKKAILSIPSRIGPIIAGENDSHTIIQILNKELKNSLQGTVDKKLKEYEVEEIPDNTD